ncbi:MerR family transcriptional regulator [Streptomyces sp. NPDC026665]|uniref:MerR family transcriptional regulator n=1 Tax=Streptomyces sp. NPDC026665 TaxID=3154798 RepID=UPI0033CA8AA4
MPTRHTNPRSERGFSRSRGGDPIPQPTEPGREDADGTLWFTIREAAAFTGRGVQTIYSWERRGHLNRAAAATDEHGHRIYNQQQIAAAERRARRNAAGVQRVAC